MRIQLKLNRVLLSLVHRILTGLNGVSGVNVVLHVDTMAK